MNKSGKLPTGLLKVSEVAKRLHMSESAIRAYIRAGTLIGYRAAGERVYRIPIEEADKLLEPAV